MGRMGLLRPQSMTFIHPNVMCRELVAGQYVSMSGVSVSMREVCGDVKRRCCEPAGGGRQHEVVGGEVYGGRRGETGGESRGLVA